MQTKTINKVIAAKVEQWLSSIDDITLRNDVRPNVVVTGGCITSMLLNEDPNDFDIYLEDVHVCKRLAEYYLKEMGYPELQAKLTDVQGNFENSDDYNRSCQDKYIHTYIPSSGFLSKKRLDGDMETIPLEEKENSTTSEEGAYHPVFITSNAITLSNKIQIITRFCGVPEKIHKNFDFSHTKMYWTQEEGVVTNINSLECVLAKRLIYSGSKFPLCSFIRTRKFIQRGWTIDAGQYVKMGIQLNGLDLLEPKTLVQQLIGVDTSYFSWMLDELTKPESLTGDGKIDKNHAINLINYMFDSEK